jgi:hypothetical protein
MRGSAAVLTETGMSHLFREQVRGSIVYPGLTVQQA